STLTVHEFFSGQPFEISMSYQAFGLRGVTEGKNGIAATHGNEVRAEAAVQDALCLVQNRCNSPSPRFVPVIAYFQEASPNQHRFSP
ncbi:MAG: hypothetical protein ACK5PB_21755, partial [Pirellula sp.]